MSQPNASYGIAITGSDRTAAAAKSAERRLGQIPKRAGIANRRFAEDGDRTLRRHSRSIIRTFRETEQAGARLFGGRSITSGIASRLGGVGAAASAVGTGLGEAAASGGVLTGALGAVGVAAGATIGILASAAYAAISVANNWAKGAASIGRTAALIGVGTKAMQEFTAAAERQGVDKGAATGALGSLSQTLNDAKYGRNTAALSVLGRLGVGMKTNADGTVNVEAMLPQIADALTRQNSSGRRTAARALGIPLEALAAFTQGGAALSADMADASKHANVLTPDQIATGERIARKGAIVGQMKDRVLGNAGALAAETMEKGYDAVIEGGQAMLDGASSFGDTVGDVFKPAVDLLDRSVKRFAGIVNYSGGGAGRLTQQGVISEARKGVALRDKLMRSGFGHADATALAANAVRESGANYRAREKGGNGVGLWQWTNRARKNDFRRVMGVAVENSSEDQQIAFLRWELRNTERKGWRRAHERGNDAASVAAGFTEHVERPLHIGRDSAERAAVARALETIPVKVEIEMRGAPAGTRATVHAGRGNRPAISRAMTN